jgi:hypothetical protein
MTPKKINKLAALSLEQSGKEVATINLGKENGLIQFEPSFEEPWLYIKMVKTDIGRHPMSSSHVDLGDLLDMLLIEDYPQEVEGNVGPFLRLKIWLDPQDGENAKKQAILESIYLNMDQGEIKTLNSHSFYED